MDTLVFVSSSELFGNYQECWGKLTKINDSIYHVKCFRYIEQREVMPIRPSSNDVISFSCDSHLIGNTFKMEYLTKSINTHKIYSTWNKFAIDKKQFNQQAKNMLVSFDYQHPIVNETVELKVSFKSDLLFKSENNPADFYVIIDDSTIKTINKHSHSYFTFGPKFTLKRMNPNDALSRGRKTR
jgi:hypothetical protein